VTRLGVFEDTRWRRLAPLTWLRASFHLWSGLAPAWRRIEALYGTPLSVVRCRAEMATLAARETPSLAEAAAAARGAGGPTLLVNGALCVEPATSGLIPLEGPDEVIASAGRIAAVRLSADALAALPEAPLPATIDAALPPSPLTGVPAREIAARFVENPWDLIADNEATLCGDFRVFARMIEARRLARSSEIGVDCFVGLDAAVSSKASLDASDGPILIGAGARIEPFAFVKGPAFVGPGAIVRAGCRVEGGSTVGPGCRVGGEVEATILHPYSNKPHDGFLGHSLVGSWVNLGAGSTTSDLKNTYGTVKMIRDGTRVDTGLRKLGSLIGDHAKIGIGALLGTGTVVGVAAQVAGVPGLIGAVPSFAWWTGEARAVHEIDRAIETARTVAGRRGRALEADEEAMLRRLYADDQEVAARQAWAGVTARGASGGAA
jgi:UDP-N-acetylglucosamine diphosphorylase/glucosamine-1-phosphate N-acetyltransferase